MVEIPGVVRGFFFILFLFPVFRYTDTEFTGMWIRELKNPIHQRRRTPARYPTDKTSAQLAPRGLSPDITGRGSATIKQGPPKNRGVILMYDFFNPRPPIPFGGFIYYGKNKVYFYVGNNRSVRRKSCVQRGL